MTCSVRRSSSGGRTAWTARYTKTKSCRNLALKLKALPRSACLRGPIGRGFNHWPKAISHWKLTMCTRCTLPGHPTPSHATHILALITMQAYGMDKGPCVGLASLSFQSGRFAFVAAAPPAHKRCKRLLVARNSPDVQRRTKRPPDGADSAGASARTVGTIRCAPGIWAAKRCMQRWGRRRRQQRWRTNKGTSLFRLNIALRAHCHAIWQGRRRRDDGCGRRRGRGGHRCVPAAGS